MSRAPVPTQTHSQCQIYPKPVMDARKLQNIWTMRPLNGTGGALKALAKNVAQHMNLNRSTLKRVVAQVVAEHHNLGQVDDYKGHMYYAKPERLNFLNLLAQSKEALDDLLLLDPRLAKKFHRRENIKKIPSRVSSHLKVRSGSGSRSKTKVVASSATMTVMPKKVGISGAAAARILGRGNSTIRLPNAAVQTKKSPRKPGQSVKKTPAKITQPSMIKDLKQEQQRSPQLKTKRNPKVQYSSSSHQRLPAGSTKKVTVNAKKPPVLVPALSKTKSKSKVKTENRAKSPVKSKTINKTSKTTKGKASKLAEKDAKDAKDMDTETDTDMERLPGQSRLLTKSGPRPRPHSKSRSRSHSPARNRSPYRSRLKSPIPSPSSLTANTVISRQALKRQQEEGITAKVLTKALTKALAKAFPQPPRLKEKRKSLQEQPVPYRNYDKPWLVPRSKRRRLVAGSLELNEKQQQEKRQEKQKQEPDEQQQIRIRKPRSHVGHQMRKVDFPWYTPYQFQGGAGATQAPSPRSSSIPLMAAKHLTSRHRQLGLKKQTEGIDNMLNYGSGLFRRHRGEWMPARKSSSQQLPSKERKKVARRSSSMHARWEVSKRRKSPKKEKSSPTKSAKTKKSSALESEKAEKSAKTEKSAPPKPSAEGFHLPPPPPSTVSSDDRVRSRAKHPADSSLGSYADLFQASDSKEALKRVKRRLSIAFMTKPGKAKGSGRRHRQMPPVWK